MATSRWTEELLDEASDQGDDPKARPNADHLAEEVMTSEGGVRSYNHLLEVADSVLASPSLVLNRDSTLHRHLAEFPGEALEYFQPAPAPDWLDKDRLRLGASLWADNSVAATGVLYALSLPCAYLYKAGVPALYETGKLAEHKYVFQRIYETGLFVDAVMDDDGIEVLEDYVPDQHHLYLEVLRELDPAGDWTQEGRGSLVRAAPGSSDQPNLQERVEAEVEKRSQPKRYLWGRGFLAARKVRFLHASIRFMLMNPDKVKSHAAAAAGSGEPQTLTDRLSDTTPLWDRKAYGVPINQEELALVLLTFGYHIPLGLERWGCRTSRKQKEAFLHLWKVIGHMMGIRDDLMTDDWDEARELVELVLKRQAGPSKFGKALTRSLMDFMMDYFPHVTPGLRHRLPAHMIISQLGRLNADYPAMILPEDVYRDTRRLLPRVLFGLGMLWIRLYYSVRDGIIARIPLVGDNLMSTLHHAAEELIASWRDQYRRRPFDIAGNKAWVKKRGANEETAKVLMAWRRRIFNNVALAVVLLFVAVAALVATGVVTLVPLAWLASKWQVVRALGAGSVVSGLLAWVVMSWRLPRVFATRPEIDLT
jgi:hypothetical protein